MCLEQWCCPLTVTRSVQSHLIPDGFEPMTVTIELERLMTAAVEQLLLAVDSTGFACSFEESAGASARYTVEILVLILLAVIEDLIGFTGEGLKAVVPKTGKPDRPRLKFDSLLLLLSEVD